MSIDYKFLENLGKVIAKFPNADLTDVFSKGQLDSKKWLVTTLLGLDLNLGTVFLCAGWYGTLASFMLDSSLKVDRIRSFDIDPTCANIADTLNRNWVIDNWKFKASTLDITKMSYPMTYVTERANGSEAVLTEMPDTIINTSCEHIEHFNKWYDSIPAGVLVILQSNNYKEVAEHVNCSDTLEDFSKTAKMSNTLFEGFITLEKYKRFMKIGYK